MLSKYMKQKKFWNRKHYYNTRRSLQSTNNWKTNISTKTKEVINYPKAIFRGYDLAEKQGFLRVNDIIKIQHELIGILKR